MKVPMFSEISRQSLWSAAADQLRQSIDSGQIKPGEKLPSERVLCTDFGISRISLREGLRALSQDGYIRVESGRGAFVLDPAERRGRLLAQWIELDRASLDKTFELRAVFEPSVAALAARHRDPATLAQMQETIDAMSDPARAPEEVILADARFHQLLAESTKNDLIVALVHFAMSATGGEREITLGTRKGVETARAGHQTILDAVARQDEAAAEQAMRLHLTDARNFAS